MMKRPLVTLLAAAGLFATIAAAALWPRQEAQAQIGLPVGVADCSCTAGTALQGDVARTRVHICQCGAQQCVITVSARGSETASSSQLQLAQTCR